MKRLALIMMTLISFSIFAEEERCLVGPDYAEAYCTNEGERSGIQYTSIVTCSLYIRHKNKKQNLDDVRSLIVGTGTKTIKSKNPLKIITAEYEATEQAEELAMEDIQSQLEIFEECR